ncbi:zinc/manganese transport system substrate-binding protein [Pseudarthrobacter defluvii]|uniref:Zinc/manganese transport system substrate-binding protein n=1 Tax=Pseudarthrobacter defluvii TaxID=410837 RepID=A0ABT9UF55_9MICC|nr:zinc ABC transporter substrate-binding protein [Pseudarthrobacter defluvii]MDQ0117641.1 zinc/manganese transport system substrate-binding protein [Pseudarthrobacter defluvii]
MRRPAAASSFLAALAGVGLLLSACSPQPSQTADQAQGINVVASTNVYGDIARTIGGDKVNVTAIINSAGQDPHSYEATAQDRLAVSKAQLVIENGGGYDDFIHTLVESSKLDSASVLTAVEVSGLAHPDEAASAAPSTTPEAAAGHDGHDHGGLNEHVWYSLPAMERMADGIADKLAALDPGAAATFSANADSFKSSLSSLHGHLDAMKAAGGGGRVAVTEPVPLYMLEDAGLANATPEQYTAAIEEGADVPPAVLKEASDLVGSKAVRLLAYNAQTEGPQTEALKKAAETAGVPVVDFTETLPEGKTYLQWMTDNVNNISKVLETNR